MSLIPLNIQLEALCLMACISEGNKIHDLLAPFVPELPKVEELRRAIYLALIKQYFSFMTNDLMAYLNDRPATCRMLLLDSSDKRYANTTLIPPMPNGHYSVGWFDRPQSSQVRAFPTLAEATADYVLFSCNLPRLTKEQSAWYEVDSFA